MTTDRIAFEKASVLFVLEQLEGIVVSLDRLGSAHADMSAEQWKQAVLDYFLTSKALKELPKCRRLLSAPFSRELGPDDMDELERNAEHAEYWSFGDFMRKHRDA